jgi:hypothetical protein
VAKVEGEVRVEAVGGMVHATLGLPSLMCMLHAVRGVGGEPLARVLLLQTHMAYVCNCHHSPSSV